MVKHLSHYSYPAIQRHIVRILTFVFVFALLSLGGYYFNLVDLYFTLTKEIYEGLTFISFLYLFMAYCGDVESVLAGKSRHRACLCIGYDPSASGFLRRCKVGVYQYIAVRAVTSVAALVLDANKRYCFGDSSPHFGYVWITVANFIATFVAFFALLCFYRPTKEEMGQHGPTWQFLSIKLVIALQLLVQLALNILIAKGLLESSAFATARQISTCLANFIACLMMAAASLLHLKVFPYQTFGDAPAMPFMDAVRDCIGLSSPSSSR
ncbi:hypothetical protein HDU91_003115 [Kappamyces sp. JEL0680]|nr:hypothetical protein HDU91_003115 [Kappamyces sp. JEL0680]